MTFWFPFCVSKQVRRIYFFCPGYILLAPWGNQSLKRCLLGLALRKSLLLMCCGDCTIRNTFVKLFEAKIKCFTCWSVHHCICTNSFQGNACHPLNTMSSLVQLVDDNLVLSTELGPYLVYRTQMTKNNRNNTAKYNDSQTMVQQCFHLHPVHEEGALSW